jgi:hypothetical protein
MNEMEAKESIDLIKDMIGKTKKAAAYSGDIYIVWGVLTLLAVLGTYLLVILKLYQYIWINWTVFMGAGFAYSVYQGITSERRADLVTFAGRILGYTWFACGVSLGILAFVAPLAGLYSPHMIPALVATVIGIGFFITGKVVQWKFLVWLSFLWWAGGTGMMFIKTESILLIFAFLMSLGYLVPGFILRANYKKVKKGQDEE